MTERPALLRRIAIALVEHAAWVFPSAQRVWATAMQHELPQIENDLEALTWAGGCLAAGYVERGKTILSNRRWMSIGLATLLVIGGIAAASWWAGQRPHLTPGNSQVIRQDSDAGGLLGFLVFVAAAIPGSVAVLSILDRRFHQAARAGRVCAVILVPYLAALAVISLLTPGTVVNIGDSYCYDLWCVGVNQVNAKPQGPNLLYTAEVRIFVDSTHPHYMPAEMGKKFFYVLDDRGRHYPLLPDASFLNAGATVHPGESVKSSFAFLAPADARKLYLMGYAGRIFLPWVYLYFGSDTSLLHRPALLRIL